MNVLFLLMFELLSTIQMQVQNNHFTLLIQTQLENVDHYGV